MPRKEGHLLVDGWKKEAYIEYPFEHGGVIYTLGGVSIHPTHYKDWAILINSAAPERKDTSQGFHHDANGDFKTVQVEWLW
jgi:hypothetical protein